MSDPEYITYLLNPDLKYKCYFIVGNPNQDTPVEKIGVVKKMLLAHSVVLRTELQESKMAEKNNVSVIDIYPATFKNLLRYVYGYNNTSELSFDDADNLLYAAEKYMISKLKDDLIRRLMDMLDYSNICSLMNNPACYRALELNNQITKMLQGETEKVLSSPQFLGLSPDAFLKVVEQETLSVREIEVWRAAIKWAKNRVDSEDDRALRRELSNHIQHIRVCTLTHEQLCSEVLPEDVLTFKEFKLVSLSVKTGEKQTSLTAVCNETQERAEAVVKSWPITVRLPSGRQIRQLNKPSIVFFHTKECDIELESISLCSTNMQAHLCDCTINIVNEYNDDEITTIRFREQVNRNSDFEIPISDNGKNVKLLAKRSYIIGVTFSNTHTHPVFVPYIDFEDFEHIRVVYDNTNYGCCISSIVYRSLLKK